MYHPDLSPFTPEVILPGEKISTLCIGWIDDNHPYTQGEISPAFVERLWLFCLNMVGVTLGYHQCPFCAEPSHFGILVRRGEDELRLGSAEIRVLGEDNIVYAAPNLVYHYVVAHQYSPPEQFIQAVLEGPLPSSAEYEKIITMI